MASPYFFFGKDNMAVDLLDAPLRVSWDFSATGPSLTAQQLQTIAKRLLDAGVFFVTLEGAPLSSPSIGPLLDQLTAGGIQVGLVLTGAEAELARLATVPASVSLLLDCATSINAGRFEPATLSQTLKRLRAAQRNPALLWVPRRGQLPLLLDLLRFCTLEAVSYFKLPNQKISVNSGSDLMSTLPNCSDLEQLAALIKTSGLPDVPQLQLEVHDLFLWELLQPLTGGQRSEYGGCQAANSLAHIDTVGQLSPCSSWPEPLGQLLDDDLLDLWQSARRLQIRQDIEQVPNGCDDCADYSLCFGGCRGLSRYCRDDGLKRDLLCSGRR